MKSHLKPIKIGNLSLSSNIIYSPLAGCTDFSFRKISSTFNPGLIFCEMVKMDALVRNDPNTYRILDFSRDMHPIGAQLCGSNPKIAGKAAKIIEDLGFDIVDLNCGCPVDKVTKDGSGSGLLKDLKRIEEILHEMISAVSIPVTIKIRVGWDLEEIVCEEITALAENIGASAISIHGRTRKQAYRGPADWSYIKKCVEKRKKILVFGNGDVFSPESAEKMFEETFCDGILVSRGTLGSPWIAEDIAHFLNKKTLIKRPENYSKEVLLSHLKESRSYRCEKKAVIDMRKVGCWYGNKELRGLLNKAKSLKDVETLLS